MKKFRFEDLNIWKESIVLADEMLDIADRINEDKYFRFSEQLRGAALSISNNIAEGSGSFSDKDFANFLTIARKSLFECANMLVIFERRKFITLEVKDDLFARLWTLSAQISSFSKAILKS